jgi:hypothetical protein
MILLSFDIRVLNLPTSSHVTDALLTNISSRMVLASLGSIFFRCFGLVSTFRCGNNVYQHVSRLKELQCGNLIVTFLSIGCAVDSSATAALPNKLDGLVLDIPVLNRLEVPALPNILDFPVPLLLLDFCTDIFDVDFLIAS